MSFDYTTRPTPAKRALKRKLNTIDLTLDLPRITMQPRPHSPTTPTGDYSSSIEWDFLPTDDDIYPLLPEYNMSLGYWTLTADGVHSIFVLYDTSVQSAIHTDSTL